MIYLLNTKQLSEVYALITSVITWESHIPTGYELCAPCLTSHITTTRLCYTTLYWYYASTMDSPNTQDIYTLNRTEPNPSTSLEHLSRTNMTCYKPSNVPKHFRHNIAQLKDASRFKIWKYWINSAITATDYKYLFTDKPKPEDNKVVHTIYVTIIDKIANHIMANYMYTGMSIMTLMSGLEEHFNPHTVTHKAYNESSLFKCNDHVKNFGQTLDKLEQIYAQLITDNLKLTDTMYWAAIYTVTPVKYSSTITVMEQAWDMFYNGKPESEY